MRLNKILLAFLAAPFLAACQNNGQKAPASPVAGNVVVWGPSDGGGGDTCNGKMIESYIVDITGLEEFKEFVQPILDKIVPPQADGKKRSPFHLTPHMKNWYIIECKLQNIPKERKGLYLETYQTAIHTSREIFIDSNSYNKMAKEEKAKLLLHEMIMSYYLMKYLSLDDLCKMASGCTGDYAVIGKWKMFRPQAYRPLNEEDHQKIRNVTSLLWLQRESASGESYAKILKNNDFDKRFDTADASENSKEIEVDIQVLLRMLKKYQWSNSFPKFCQFGSDTNVSSSNCKTDIIANIKEDKLAGSEVKVKQLYLKIKITRESDKQEFTKEFSYPLTSEHQKVKLYMNKIGPVLSAAPFPLFGNWPGYPGIEIQEGLKSQVLFFMLNLSDLANPEIYQILFHTYVWYSFADEIVEKDGATSVTTYGYPTLLPDESESVFIENELPFRFNSVLQNKVFIKFKQTTP